jgi:hypothetical protein
MRRAAWAAIGVLLAAGASPAQELQLHEQQQGPAPAPPQESSPVRVGLLLGVVNTPRPVGAEVMVRLHDLVAVGAGYSALPKGLGDAILSIAGVSDASIEASGFDGEVRLFPFRGSFFVGSALGVQSLTASATRAGTTVSVDMTTLYATPRLGWLGVWSSGLSLGFDAGVQLPLSTDVSAASNNGDAARRAAQAASAVGNTPLPSISLRVGFFL